MSDINAAIGLANLPYSDEVLARHGDNAAYHDSQLAAVPGLELTERADDRRCSFWIYPPMWVDERDAFVKQMDAAEIMVSQVHLRDDLHTCVREYAVLLPDMDRVDERLVCIPVGWWVSDREREGIVDAIRSGW